jgi:hypothetical protein
MIKVRRFLKETGITLGRLSIILDKPDIDLMDTIGIIDSSNAISLEHMSSEELVTLRNNINNMLDKRLLVLYNEYLSFKTLIT